jgi:hypothetical protein
MPVSVSVAVLIAVPVPVAVSLSVAVTVTMAIYVPIFNCVCGSFYSRLWLCLCLGIMNGKQP